MKALIAAAVLLVLGMGAIIAMRESRMSPGGGAVDHNAVIATISTGEEVDIDQHIPPTGVTIVEFTAEF